MGTDSNQLHTTAIVPVKGLSTANGRLNGLLSEDERTRLAEALFLDLIVKLPRSRRIDDVLIVTADPSVARQAGWFDHKVLVQEPDVDLSPEHLAADGAKRVAMLPVDCPMLDMEELDAHLGRSARTALIVPDRHGTGTNALMLNPPELFLPAFGPYSCARHVSRARATGQSFALEEVESLSTDLDTPEDFTLLRDQLLLDPQPEPRTAKVLWQLGDRVQQPGGRRPWGRPASPARPPPEARRLSLDGQLESRAADSAPHRDSRAARAR